MINNKKQYKIALLGSQIKYSLSSKIHNAAFYYLKMNWYYECIEIKCYNNFNWPKFFVKLMKLGFIGANVTAPFKQSLLPYLHKLSNIVLCIKATNTLKFNDSYCFGYNTDAFGFAQDLYKNNILVKGKKVIVLGAGGSAYAVAFALLKLGVSRLYIFNRDYNKAILLVKQMKIMFIDVIINAKVLNKSSLLSIKTADVVINCISIGLFHPNKNILETVEFSSNQVVYDLNYDENSTFFLERAKEYGAKTFNGIGMLLYQAISSFEIWTGRTAPKSIMIQAINKNY